MSDAKAFESGSSSPRLIFVPLDSPLMVMFCMVLLLLALILRIHTAMLPSSRTPVSVVTVKFTSMFVGTPGMVSVNVYVWLTGWA